jgi:hypothetical protein
MASGIRIIGREDFSDYRRYPSEEIESIIRKTVHRTRSKLFLRLSHISTAYRDTLN